MKLEFDEFSLRKQAEAAKSLIAMTRDDLGEDDAAKLDLVEGETSLIEAIETVLKMRDDDLILVEGIAARVEELKGRKERLAAAAERKKSLIEQAMVAAEIKTLPLPIATLSISNRAPNLIVVEEADIPSTYFKPVDPPPPRLDRTALTKALRERRNAMDEASKAPDDVAREAAIAAIDLTYPSIPGVDLDNGGVSLSIRVK